MASVFSVFKAGQLCELDGLLAVTRANSIQKAIFIGDQMEVATNEENEELPNGPLSTSYMDRLKRGYDVSVNITDLEVQFTIAPEILRYPNKAFYSDILIPER